MSRIDRYYTDFFKPSSLDSFVICPESFLKGKTAQELKAMQQLYKSAYEKALKEYRNNHGHEFDMGAGI